MVLVLEISFLGFPAPLIVRNWITSIRDRFSPTDSEVRQRAFLKTVCIHDLRNRDLDNWYWSCCSRTAHKIQGNKVQNIWCRPESIWTRLPEKQLRPCYCVKCALNQTISRKIVIVDGFLSKALWTDVPPETSSGKYQKTSGSRWAAFNSWILP